MDMHNTLAKQRLNWNDIIVSIYYTRDHSLFVLYFVFVFVFFFLKNYITDHGKGHVKNNEAKVWQYGHETWKINFLT